MSIEMTPKEAYVEARKQGYGTPELEAVIATNDCWSFFYANDVIKGRFPLGESAIAKSEFWWEDYLKYIPMTEEDKTFLILKYGPPK